MDAALKSRARKLNLVGSSQLTRAVAEAVRRGLAKQFVLQEEQLEQAVRAIGRELMERLKANSKSVRGVPKDAFLKEVKADKQRIELAKEAARAELDTLLTRLKQSHEEIARHEATLKQESRATGRVEDQALSERIAELFAGGESSDDIAGLREKITALALGSMQGQREKSIDAQMADHRREVNAFERRIAKLTNSLELTEEELKRIAKAKNIEVGVGSIYRNVQGLSGVEDDYETKKELMSSIFAANLELQKGSAEAS
ncbi:MAG: hypothetical protein ACI9F9_002727 [Candidatus Paceibacteria bacterium]|jgi:hypothetical protein